jgi:amidase
VSDSASDGWHYLELAELALHIQSGAVTPSTVTRLELDRIMALDPLLGSYALVMADSAMEHALIADAEIASGHYRGLLHGVPVAVKDLFWTEGVPTRGGTTIHKNFRPVKDATVVRRLKEAGAVVLGKLEMTEGAYSDHHPSIRPPRNPWGSDYWPGISSSGPGVATAAGLCFGALGSDTGGSIRWPCAANGLTGLKPTWGRVSRHGMLPLAPSLDHVGPMTRSAVDAAVILGAIAGPDADDPTARTAPVPDYLASARRGARGLRIGIDANWNGADVDGETQRVLADAIDVFQELGALFIEVRVPDVTQAIADWAANCAVEAAVAHEATYPSQKNEYGPVLASVIDAGRDLSGINYQKILLRRMDLAGRIGALFSGVDLLLTPVQPFDPLTLDTIRTLGTQPDLIVKLQRYTCAFDMTGNPTLTLPGGFSSAGLPIAFQLVAADLGEAALIQAGAAFQAATSWHRRHPALMVPGYTVPLT